MYAFIFRPWYANSIYASFAANCYISLRGFALEDLVLVLAGLMSVLCSLELDFLSNIFSLIRPWGLMSFLRILVDHTLYLGHLVKLSNHQKNSLGFY